MLRLLNRLLESIGVLDSPARESLHARIRQQLLQDVADCTGMASPVFGREVPLGFENRAVWELERDAKAQFLSYLSPPGVPPGVTFRRDCRNCGAPFEPDCPYCGTVDSFWTKDMVDYYRNPIVVVRGAR